MGAWGSGNFENDDAMDWVWLLEDDRDGSVLRDALAPVAERRPSNEPPEVEASLALAAAAVVARARGWSREQLPDGAEAWVSEHALVVDSELVALARAAAIRVRDVLDGEQGSEEWLAAAQRLVSDLGA